MSGRAGVRAATRGRASTSTSRGQRCTRRVYATARPTTCSAPRARRRSLAHRPARACGRGAAEGGRLTAPMPGKVVSFAVKAGDKVSKGQALAVMEAMKMEHTIAAPADGTVAELLYAPGDQVAEGAELLSIAGHASTHERIPMRITVCLHRQPSRALDRRPARRAARGRACRTGRPALAQADHARGLGAAAAVPRRAAARSRASSTSAPAWTRC